MEKPTSDISRENMALRRFSASNSKSFRYEERCLRSTITISSTASSPGCMHTTSTREEIDPSTYSFTTALKALQAKTVYSWEYVALPSSHRLTLHSKWSDAEKYISNPVSGQVPLECLSAKTLPLNNRITISTTKYPLNQNQHHKPNITIQEKKTKDVGTQSTAADVNSGSPSPISTPSINERPKRHAQGDSPDQHKPQEAKREEREAAEKEGEKRKQGREIRKKKMVMVMVMCREGGGRIRGCLQSFKGLWKKRDEKNTNPLSSPTFLYHINACFDQ